MRIEPPSNDPKVKGSSIKGSKTKKKGQISRKSESTFLNIFEETEDELIRKTLEEMVSDVVEAGNDFVRSPTPDNLKKYKSKIKEVLRYIEKNLYKIAGKYDFSASQPRLHIVAEEIDEKILKISSLLMEAEKDTIKIAEKVGEINGLIFDLYK